MIGIIGYGGYVPHYRIKTNTVSISYNKKSKEGEKAVAYYDEDSVTMAVAASLNCLHASDPKGLEAVFFASTTAPYAEKQCATNISAAIDARTDIRTADFSSSLRAGSEAMLSAIDRAECGKNTLVAIGDCRMGAPEGQSELDLGDGAAAFVFGNENVIAQVIGSHSMSMDFNDVWRAKDDRFIRNWDTRYSVTQLYEPVVTQTLDALFEKTKLQPSDFSKVILYAHEDRQSLALAMKLGFSQGQIQPSMYECIGNTGCAGSPLMLIGALEHARPGDRLLFVTYGEGCDAIAFEVTEQVRGFKPYRTIESFLKHKDNDLMYGKYLKWRKMIAVEPQKRPEQERSALPDYFRNYLKNNALYGSVCTVCHTPYFPSQRVCVKCHSVDAMEPYRFYGKNAKIRTFTFDGLSLSLDSPNYLVMVDFEGGGKLTTYLADCKKEDLYMGMPVTMSFRKMFEANGVQTYFWKAIPKFSSEEENNDGD